MIALIGIVLALFLALAYFSRGWLRDSAIPWTVEKLYASQIDQVFEESIEPVNKILKPYKISFEDTGYGENDRAGCDNGLYHHFQETVLCERYQNAQVIDVPPALRSDWPNVSQEISGILTEKGWSLDGSETHEHPVYSEDLGKLLSAERGAAVVAYTKQVDKIYCMLNFKYDAGSEGYEPYISVYEECQRVVKIFGGYEY